MKALLLLALLLAGCGGARPLGEAGPPPDDLRARAEALARRLVVVDTHIDVPYRVFGREEDLSSRTAGGDFDYPRAVAGGLDVAFMSIYIPAERRETGGAKALADSLIDLVEGFARRWPGQFELVRSPAEVRARAGQDHVLLALGMENGEPIEGELANLRHFYDRGIRYVTLAHGRANHLSDSSYDPERPWNGLSPFGRRVVSEMNRLGMMVDVSHLSDSAFYDVLALSRAPVIASHSSARRFTPGWERNMDDEMIRRLAERGGVIQITFGSSFVSDRYRREAERMDEAVEAYRQADGLAAHDPALRAFAERYRAEHPNPYADVSEVADHIDHVVRLVGIDHVGLGSDFDGVGDSLPVGLKDVSEYPNLFHELLRRGYGEADLEKLAGGNLLRVWAEVERMAGPGIGNR